jgi:hypothetical protein
MERDLNALLAARKTLGSQRAVGVQAGQNGDEELAKGFSRQGAQIQGRRFDRPEGQGSGQEAQLDVKLRNEDTDADDEDADKAGGMALALEMERLLHAFDADLSVSCPRLYAKLAAWSGWKPEQSGLSVSLQ